MSADMNLEGMEGLISRIETMGKAGTRIEGKALKAAGTVMVDAAKNILESNGNVATGKLKDSLKVSGIRKKGNKKYVQVGIQKEDNSEIFYGKFLEWGTSKMNARPFLGPAYASKRNEAKEILMNELKQGLGL